LGLPCHRQEASVTSSSEPWRRLRCRSDSPQGRVLSSTHTKEGDVKPRLLVKLLVAVAVFATGSLTLSGAIAGGSRDSATLDLFRIGSLPQQQSSLDPGSNQGFPTGSNLMFDHLMTFGRDGKLRPSLALKVTQPGPAVYVYHLRHGVKFWDG